MSATSLRDNYCDDAAKNIQRDGDVCPKADFRAAFVFRIGILEYGIRDTQHCGSELSVTSALRRGIFREDYDVSGKAPDGKKPCGDRLGQQGYQRTKHYKGVCLAVVEHREQ